MSESYLKGLEEIAAIDPENGPLFVEELKKFSPDFAAYFVDFAFGRIHARQVLETRVKELIAIASLIAIGDVKSHLRLRIQGALRLGCRKDEIIEVIIQSIVHVGFTRATAALNLVREVCGNDDEEATREDGSSVAPVSHEKKSGGNLTCDQNQVLDERMLCKDALLSFTGSESCFSLDSVVTRLTEAVKRL